MNPTPPSPSQPSGTRLWWLGARPRTLPAAVVPVAVGVGAGIAEAGAGAVIWWKAALALAVSLLLQVGVNYANDYSDGVRGTDDVRVGPMRLVASGVVPARQVKVAALTSFGLAGVAGAVLAATTSWWLIAVGAAAIAAAWGYTGGPRPYGYMGLGELFVFVFFGVVATTGTTFVAVGSVAAVAWLASVGVGAVACALLVINNLRDIPTDREVGKRTLAVRLGDRSTRWFYSGLLLVALICGAACSVWAPWSWLVLASTPLAIPLVRTVRGGAVGADLIQVLVGTGRFQLAYGALLAIGLAI